MSIRGMETSEEIFSLSESDMCRLCGLSSISGYLIHEKENDTALSIADLINQYLPIQVDDNDGHPRIICSNCKSQLDQTVKFFDDIVDGQIFLKNIHKMYKSRQFSSDQYAEVSKMPLTDKKTSTFKNNAGTKSNDEEIVCEICGLMLANKTYLKTHTKNHHGETLNDIEEILETTDTAQRFSCELCKKTFAHKSGLNTHLRTHKGEKMYECKVCKQRYYQNGNLQEHMRIHTGEKPFSCNYCLVAFRTSSQLKTHIRCHNGDKPYKCSVCEKSFSHNNTLKSHIRRHYNDRQYDCEFCPKKFIDRTSLVRHLRTHTGEKPYFCTICNKDFATRTNFNKHRKIHEKDKNAIVWELTTKFQKDNSEVDYINTAILNDNNLDNLDSHNRTEDLIFISSQVKDLNGDMASNENNLDDLLNVNTSFTSLNSISFTESILELDENNVP